MNAPPVSCLRVKRSYHRKVTSYYMAWCRYWYWNRNL